MSTVELNMVYHLHTDDEDNQHQLVVEIGKPAHNEWSWLDKCILYLPMICFLRPDGTRRNPYCCIILNIINIMCCAPWMIISYYWLFTDGNKYLFLDINYAGAYTLEFIARLFSLHYFYSKFNYPWYSVPQKFNLNDNHKSSKRYSKLALIMVIIASITRYTLDSGINIHDTAYWQFPFDIAYISCFHVPMFVVYAIHIAICSKYMTYLSELIQEIEIDDIEMEIILEKYKILSESFDIDYPSSLRYSLQIHLFAMLLDAWFSVYGLVDGFYPLFWIIFTAVATIFTVLIYTLPASNLNDLYTKFESALWKSSKNCIMNHKGYGINSFFLQFIHKWSITVCVGDFIVTKSNLIKFAIVFGLTKFATDAIRYFLDS